MPTTFKIEATTTTETVKTYFIKTYADEVVFVKTTGSKFDSLLNLIEVLGVDIANCGEMSNFKEIYEF